MSTAVIFDLLLILFFDLNATLFTCPRLLYHWQHCFLSRDTETSSQDKLGVHTRSVPMYQYNQNTSPNCITVYWRIRVPVNTLLSI